MYWFEREKKEGGEKHLFIIPLIYTFIGYFFYVTRPGIKSATLAYWDDALTNKVTCPGPYLIILDMESYREEQNGGLKLSFPFPTKQNRN